jgi:transcriptional regulator with XRE-family HTH domain
VIPFCDTPTLTFAKPKRHYPLALVSLGDHLLKGRLDLGYTRKYAASLIGVDPESLKNWERAETEPAVGFFPRLVSYLGYNPLPRAEGRGSRIRRERISRGLSRKALADSVGVDEATIKRMEEDLKGMAKRAIRAICHELDVEIQ